MNRHRDTCRSLSHDMMAPINALERPSSLLKPAQQFLAAHSTTIHLSWCVDKKYFQSTCSPPADSFPYSGGCRWNCERHFAIPIWREMNGLSNESLELPDSSFRQLITLAVNNVIRYYTCMIASFNESDTESLAGGTRVKRFANIEAVARRKLRQLEIAASLDDLRVPPGNRLEGLKGNRAGQHSIRINDQFRVCFRWRGDSAFDVEITDYH